MQHVLAKHCKLTPAGAYLTADFACRKKGVTRLYLTNCLTMFVSNVGQLLVTMFQMQESVLGDISQLAA